MRRRDRPVGADFADGPYQLLPPLADDEFAALKADIVGRGVLVPIEVDQTGAVLDGHHRLRAWCELRAEGVRIPDYPRVVRRFETEDAKVEHALVLNTARRHLPVAGRRQLVIDLADRGLSGRRIAELLGVHHRTVGRDLKMAVALSSGAYAPPAESEPADADRGKGLVGGPVTPPGIVATSGREQARAQAALVELGDQAPGRLVELRRAEERSRIVSLDRRRSLRPSTSGTGPGWALRCADFRTVTLDPGSVDAVIVDPPYVADFDRCWADLAEWSADVLRPGRVLVTYCGHFNQDRVMADLGRHLSFVWAGVTVQHGRHNRVRARQVHSSNRPWLVYSAGAYQARGWMQDTLLAEGRGERAVSDHPWRQALGPFRTLVETFTKPGELVVDPCCGQGTTGVAAIVSGRRFLGVDIDPGALGMATEALEAAAGDLEPTA